MLVLFDLDETLIKGDSAYLWVQFCFQKQLVNSDFLQQSHVYQEQYRQKTLNIEEYLTFFLSIVKGFEKSSIDILVDEFIKSCIKPYPKALELIESYKNERKIIISATSDFLVSKIAKSLNIDESIAINTELKNGIFSGKSYGVHSFQEGKVTRLKEYLKNDYEILMKDSCFYTDSINDLPLLQEVTHKIACNADGALLEIAKRRQYTIMNLYP